MTKNTLITPYIGIQEMLIVLIENDGPNEVGLVEVPLDNGMIQWTFSAGLASVDMVLPESALALSLNDFSSSYIEPAAASLAHATQRLPDDWIKKNQKPGFTFLGTQRET